MNSVLIGLMLLAGQASCSRLLPKPLVWNVANIDSVLADSLAGRTAEYILTRSDKYCVLNPVVVTEKNTSFAEDPHYYCSVSGYYWLDSTGVYVPRDGERNPYTKDYDADRLSEFVNRCKFLSVAHYLSGERKYYDAFVDQLRAWFIDEETYMYPSFSYAGIVPGQNDNKGKSSGIIQAYVFIDVIESILLVNAKTPLEDNVLLPVRKWFADFAEWLENGEFGAALQKAQNNIGLAYDVMLTEFYLFSGKIRKAKAIIERFPETRLYAQINENGEQKAELKRTRAFSYSLYNLSHILDFCFMTQYLGIDFYQEHQDIIDKAYAFLQQYENRQKDFPYKQITDWRSCQQELHAQLFRCERLKGDVGGVKIEQGKRIALNSLLY